MGIKKVSSASGWPRVPDGPAGRKGEKETNRDPSTPVELAKCDPDVVDEWMRSSGAGSLYHAFGFCAGPRVEATDVDVVDAVISFANGAVSPRRPVEGERNRARAMLSAAAEGEVKLLFWISDDTRTFMSGREVHKVPALCYAHPDKNYMGTKIEWPLEGPRQARPWIRFAAFVLSEGAVDRRTSVGQCKWDQCGRFFRVIIKGRGQPARNYCPDSDHRTRARPVSTERVRNWRIEKRRTAAKHK